MTALGGSAVALREEAGHTVGPHAAPVRKTGKRLRWRTVAALIVVLVAALTIPAAAEARQAVVLEIDGAIGPAIADYAKTRSGL